MQVEDLTLQLIFREGGGECVRVFALSSVGFVRVLSEGGEARKE